MADAVPFRRTIWSTTIDSGDERNDCTLWSGPAAGVAHIVLRLQLVGPEVGPSQAVVRVTPQALVSNDGETWTPAGWIGSVPASIIDHAPRQLGPFEIDPAHGKRFLRIALTTAAPGMGLVVGSVVGTLHLVGP